MRTRCVALGTSALLVSFVACCVAASSPTTDVVRVGPWAFVGRDDSIDGFLIPSQGRLGPASRKERLSKVSFHATTLAKVTQLLPIACEECVESQPQWQLLAVTKRQVTLLFVNETSVSPSGTFEVNSSHRSIVSVVQPFPSTTSPCSNATTVLVLAESPALHESAVIGLSVSSDALTVVWDVTFPVLDLVVADDQLANAPRSEGAYFVAAGRTNTSGSQNFGSLQRTGWVSALFELLVQPSGATTWVRVNVSGAPLLVTCGPTELMLSVTDSHYWLQSTHPSGDVAVVQRGSPSRRVDALHVLLRDARDCGGSRGGPKPLYLADSGTVACFCGGDVHLYDSDTITELPDSPFATRAAIECIANWKGRVFLVSRTAVYVLSREAEDELTQSHDTVTVRFWADLTSSELLDVQSCGVAPLLGAGEDDLFFVFGSTRGSDFNGEPAAPVLLGFSAYSSSRRVVQLTPDEGAFGRPAFYATAALLASGDGSPGVVSYELAHALQQEPVPVLRFQVKSLAFSSASHSLYVVTNESLLALREAQNSFDVVLSGLNYTLAGVEVVAFGNFLAIVANHTSYNQVSVLDVTQENLTSVSVSTCNGPWIQAGCQLAFFCATKVELVVVHNASNVTVRVLRPPKAVADTIGSSAGVFDGGNSSLAVAFLEGNTSTVLAVCLFNTTAARMAWCELQSAFGVLTLPLVAHNSSVFAVASLPTGAALIRFDSSAGGKVARIANLSASIPFGVAIANLFFTQVATALSSDAIAVFHVVSTTGVVCINGKSGAVVFVHHFSIPPTVIPAAVLLPSSVALLVFFFAADDTNRTLASVSLINGLHGGEVWNVSYYGAYRLPSSLPRVLSDGSSVYFGLVDRRMTQATVVAYSIFDGSLAATLVGCDDAAILGFVFGRRETTLTTVYAASRSCVAPFTTIRNCKATCSAGGGQCLPFDVQGWYAPFWFSCPVSCLSLASAGACTEQPECAVCNAVAGTSNTFCSASCSCLKLSAADCMADIYSRTLGACSHCYSWPSGMSYCASSCVCLDMMSTECDASIATATHQACQYCGNGAGNGYCASNCTCLFMSPTECTASVTSQTHDACKYCVNADMPFCATACRCLDMHSEECTSQVNAFTKGLCRYCPGEGSAPFCAQDCTCLYLGSECDVYVNERTYGACHYCSAATFSEYYCASTCDCFALATECEPRITMYTWETCWYCAVPGYQPYCASQADNCLCSTITSAANCERTNGACSYDASTRSCNDGRCFSFLVRGYASLPYFLFAVALVKDVVSLFLVNGIVPVLAASWVKFRSRFGFRKALGLAVITLDSPVGFRASTTATTTELPEGEEGSGSLDGRRSTLTMTSPGCPIGDKDEDDGAQPSERELTSASALLRDAEESSNLLRGSRVSARQIRRASSGQTESIDVLSHCRDRLVPRLFAVDPNEVSEDALHEMGEQLFVTMYQKKLWIDEDTLVSTVLGPNCPTAGFAFESEHLGALVDLYATHNLIVLTSQKFLRRIAHTPTVFVDEDVLAVLLFIQSVAVGTYIWSANDAEDNASPAYGDMQPTLSTPLRYQLLCFRLCSSGAPATISLLLVKYIAAMSLSRASRCPSDNPLLQDPVAAATRALTRHRRAIHVLVGLIVLVQSPLLTVALAGMVLYPFIPVAAAALLVFVRWIGTRLLDRISRDTLVSHLLAFLVRQEIPTILLALCVQACGSYLLLFLQRNTFELGYLDVISKDYRSRSSACLAYVLKEEIHAFSTEFGGFAQWLTAMLPGG